MTLIFAEAGIDVISGASGWAGAGLLGMVLAWLLLFHLPSKDKQIDKMIQDKDKIIDGLMDDHRAEMQAARQDFMKSLDVVVEHCEREISRHASTRT